MSGGAFDYKYYALYDLASWTGDKEIRMLLNDLATLMKSEEWYKSGDTCYEDWDADRKAFKKKWFKDSREDRLRVLIEEEFQRTKQEMENLL